jgi:hypothetical protein
MNELTNPIDDTPNEKCEICGWWVERGNHRWYDCAHLINTIGIATQTEIPQAFYDAWKDEEA